MSAHTLVDESIHIIREAAAEALRPVMLYSIGKDSTVLLDLAREAFAPSPIPFELLHIDTTWKFRDMIEHRNRVAQSADVNLIVHTNAQGLLHGVGPFTHGSAYTDVMKTQALRQALDIHRFDVVLAGARRDEDASRAKERIFSVRQAGHTWNPREQRPEFWADYNTRLRAGQTMRVFALSNWTEVDIWRYIKKRALDVVPLYFAASRPVVRRAGQWIMVDDARFVLRPGEVIEQRSVRFRTLGCYPLTGAVESHAASVDDILTELECARTSERQGRLIDGQDGSTMEAKKRQGYF